MKIDPTKNRRRRAITATPLYLEDSSDNDELEYFDDQKEEEKKSYKSFAALKVTLLLVFALTIGNTLASNITLTTGGSQEFGQGISLTTSCDRTLVVTPISTYLQVEGVNGFRLSAVSISGIDTTQNLGGSDEGCRNRSFRIKAYSEIGTVPLANFTFSLNKVGKLLSGDGNTQTLNEGSTDASILINFEDSNFVANEIYVFTIESFKSQLDFNEVSNLFSGETISALSSTNGDVLYLMTGGDDNYGFCSNCKLYRSVDFGTSWTYKSFLPDFLWQIVGSADGQKLVGANWGGNIFTSSNSGETWANRGNPDSWWHLSSSSSGQLIAGVTEKQGFKVSRDYGQTWTSPLSPPNGTYIQSAITPDGSKIIVTQNGSIQYSSDAGQTWTERPHDKNWSAVAMSDSGNIIYATENMDVGSTKGRIWKSLDYGLTWRASSISNSWWGIETTSNGQIVVAFATDKVDSIFISRDYGSTWQRSSTPYYIDSIALNSSGEELIMIGGPVLWGERNIYRMELPIN